MNRWPILVLTVVLAASVSISPASAFDGERTFAQGSIVLSVEGGYGWQDNLEGHTIQTGLEFANGGIRLSLLPLRPTLRGPLRGALEVGLQPIYQRYVRPTDAFFAGLGAVARYHFLGLGRVVPYVEIMGAAGGTDLQVLEIRSAFSFLVHGGVGLSVFLTEHAAVYGGYRLQHVSNGNVERPNRGFESHSAVLGFSMFFR